MAFGVERELDRATNLKHYVSSLNNVTYYKENTKPLLVTSEVFLVYNSSTAALRLDLN